MSIRIRALTLTTVALLAVAMPASHPNTASDANAPHSSRTAVLPAVVAAETRPNIIFFLADDMATYQLPHMPNTRRFIFRRGARFTNYYANISLCCPSRVSLLTGKYAHNTGVDGNSFPEGFHGFHVGDEPTRTVAISLRRGAGYTTGLLGKYLNEYPFVESSPSNAVRRNFVPPGWTEWAVPIQGEFFGNDYLLNVNGRIKHKSRPRDYLGDLLTRRAIRKIERNRDGSGLMLVLSSHGPHMPEPASPVERNDAALNARINRLAFPRTPDFNEADVSDKPRHIRRLPQLTPAKRAEVDRIYRRQLISLASIDRHVGEVVQALRRTKQLSNTYLVFSSDNGYHMGNHRLPIGKNTPYLTDLRLSLGIRGPGIAPGTLVPDLTGTIDVAPTLADMAGIELPYIHDGESLLPLAQGGQPEVWRRFFLVQRGFVDGVPGRPGAEPARPAERRADGLTTGWRGVVTQRWQYARYRNGDEELYDRSADPHQLNNILARPPAEQTSEQRQALRDLQEALRLLSRCVGPTNCRVR